MRSITLSPEAPVGVCAIAGAAAQAKSSDDGGETTTHGNSRCVIEAPQASPFRMPA